MNPRPRSGASQMRPTEEQQTHRLSNSAGRVLASRPKPVPGESLVSYIERLCNFQSIATPISTMLVRTQLTSRDFHAEKLYGYGVVMSDEQLATFSRVVRLSPEQVQGMLLSSYNNICLDLEGVEALNQESIRVAAIRNWSTFAGSNLCPGCISHDQAWRVAWKVPWTLICRTHQTFLVNTCPGCGERPGGFRADLGGKPRFVTTPPVPGFCSNPKPEGQRDQGRSAVACGYDLGTVPAVQVTDPSLLTLQTMLDALLENQPMKVAGSHLPAREVFQQLRSLVSLILYVAQPTDLDSTQPEVVLAFVHMADERDRRRASGRDGIVEGEKKITSFYRAAPTDPLLLAGPMKLAMHILASDDQDTMVTRLRPIVTRLREVLENKAWNAASDFNFEGPLLTACNVLLTAQAQLPRRIGRNAVGALEYDFEPRHVRPLLSQSEFDLHFKSYFHDTDLEEASARKACSIVLVQLCSKMDRAAAVQVLGFPHTHVNGLYNKAMGVINAGGHTPAFDAAIKAAARRLSEAPHKIDYLQHRASMESWMTLADSILNDEIRLLYQQAPMLMTSAKARNSAAWIWAEVAGSLPGLSPMLNDGTKRKQTLTDVYARFVQFELPTLRPWLEEYSYALIDALTPEGASFRREARLFAPTTPPPASQDSPANRLTAGSFTGMGETEIGDPQSGTSSRADGQPRVPAPTGAAEPSGGRTPRLRGSESQLILLPSGDWQLWVYDAVAAQNINLGIFATQEQAMAARKTFRVSDQRNEESEH